MEGRIVVKQSTELSRYVGNKIREFRRRANFTQKELGEKINVKHNTISAYEKGTVSPEQDSMFALSRVLDVKLDDFFPAHEENNDLDRAVSMSDNLDVDDMYFLKELLAQVNSMQGEERKRFMDNIRLAVEFHKSNKR